MCDWCVSHSSLADARLFLRLTAILFALLAQVVRLLGALIEFNAHNQALVRCDA